jgi:chromate transporter
MPQVASMDARPAAVPSLFDIFVVFASVSLSGFGGVLAWARRGLVERRKWLTAEEFNDLFALAQFLPGTNVVNLSVVYGSRLRGPWGAVAALAGLLGPPLVLTTTLGILYSEFADVDALRRALAGVSAAAAGLLIATVAKMGLPLVRDWVTVVIGAATLIAVGVFHIAIPLALVVLLPVSIGVAWWVRR